MNYVDEFWQLYLNELSFPVEYFGVFSAFTSITVIPGSLLSYKLKAKFSYKSILLIFIFSFTVTLFIIALFKGITGMIGIIFIGFIMGIIDPLVSGYLHHRTSSQIRATIGSFQSLIEKFSTILIGLVFGYISTELSIFNGYGMLGVICLIYIIIFCSIVKKTELER